MSHTKIMRSKDSKTKLWIDDKTLSREDGPAVEWDDGTFEWWFKGERYTLAEWNEITNFYTDEEMIIMNLKRIF